ncbi:MAG: UDP-N-acetylmuramoyl-tripeptide--D-alanyl-D-alanine ligase [Pyrinomonadaceae bacterium]|nr:UDP-N-acetylmuramoyl-tripeptide--D-alanyl-D-alanine ligase [Sphingobacteriaceae bacterium]
MEIKDLYSIYSEHPTICTDTRKIIPGCIFFALKGDNFDGNVFASQALKDGAAFAVIDKPENKTSDKFILVIDVLTALQQLANYHRKTLSIPFIGITGTNGKTTTKELIKSVLSEKYTTYATLGNLNNHIGVPLTILSIDKHVEIAIIEMGANHQKEIAQLCEIAEPDFGLITNVGKAHLEGFGGFKGVKKGKGELYDFLKENGGITFLNRDNLYLTDMAIDKKLSNIEYYSTNSSSAIKGELIENNPFLIIDWVSDSTRNRVKTHLTGPYNLENILAAIAIGKHFKLTNEEINQGITSYNPGNNRSQVKKTENNTLICDYYNANPSSMNAAIDNFATLSASNKVLILGDMFELGEESDLEHLMVMQKALATPANERIFIGKQFSQNQNQEGRFYTTIEEAFEGIKSKPLRNATILIKGSRGMALEKLVELL